jgi:hypothetical protein
MRNLIRSPLTWMIAAEVVVVGALIVVAWNVIVSSTRPVAALPAIQAPDSTADAASPLPDLPALNPQRGIGPLPGLNVDSAFWRDRLAELNREQVDFEAVEWRIVHSAEDAVHQYLETVVLPAVRHAEHAGGGALA